MPLHQALIQVERPDGAMAGSGARRSARCWPNSEPTIAPLLTARRFAGIDNLGLPDNCLDVAMGTFMIHHLPDEVTRNGLVELHRVLKPGGRLLMIDFKRTDEGKAKPEKFGEGTIGVTELAALLEASGFSHIEQGEIPIRIRSVARSHNDYGYVLATTNSDQT